MPEFLQIKLLLWINSGLLSFIGFILIYLASKFISRLEKLEKVQTCHTDVTIDWVRVHNTEHPNCQIDIKRLLEAKEGKA